MFLYKVVKLINNSSATFIKLTPGEYRFECWGAQGGIGLNDGEKIYPGGKGAYVSGDIRITARTQLYLFVGGKGEDGNAAKNTVAKGGFNGGGNGGSDTRDDEGAGAGGGSSDIRVVNGSWNNYPSLVSRIMVAAGGSGSVFNTYGAPGGTLNGLMTTGKKIESYGTSSINQTYGFALGIGQNGKNRDETPSSGAGSGYYGGLAVDGIDDASLIAVSYSGSSFISGHEGCNAVNDSGAHTNSPNRYPRYIFKNTTMKSGNDNFLSPFNVVERGHSGDGAIKVTLIKEIYTYNYRKIYTIIPFICVLILSISTTQ